MADVEKLTKETIKNGGVQALLYFDLHGSSEEVLTNLSAGFIQKLLKEPGVVWAIGEIDKPIGEEGSFSTSIEVKILTKDIVSLAKLCANYSPFAIEILKPNEIRLSLDKAHELLVFLSNTTFDYKKYIIEKLSTPDDLEKYKKSIEHKVELGKRLLEKKGE